LFERYPAEPYRFIPPRRSRFWSWMSKHLIPYQVRNMGVVRWQFAGQEQLRESVRQGAGVLLTPNHCRWTDPSLVGLMGVSVKQYLYYIASAHLFRQSKVKGWLMNRIGGYSIWREGVDRESIRATVGLLRAADRPVVLFPEGTWFRQNDCVGPLQEGLSLIVRQAVKQSNRPIVIHPVGIKYWLLQDPRPELQRRLGAIEGRLGWRPQDHLELVGRIDKVSGALLAIKEIEHFGAAQSGTLDERIARLVGSHVTGLEKRYLNKEHDGWPLDRIRRLRQLLVRKLIDGRDDAELVGELRLALHDLLFCENINAHSQDYLRRCPSLERLTETVQRIEETLTDGIEVPVAPMGAVVAVGPALDVRALASAKGAGKGPDPLVAQVRAAIQQQVDRLLAEGPPPAWNCPLTTQPSA
jgi:1-acyl-sn-glycerol-3-phosphate acyltransferase